MDRDPIPVLDVPRLLEIESFKEHVLTIWDLRSILIVFQVKYSDGLEGLVFGGPDIPGKLPAGTDQQELHDKVEASKNLVQEEYWIKWLKRYGVKREKMLQLSGCGELEHS